MNRADGPGSRAAPRPPLDGWVGTRELPGYRAGSFVARLDELPQVDPDHLYFDLLLLDGVGRPQQTHSGPCPALERQAPLDGRSRFVRVVAELVRHAPGDDQGLAAIAPALNFLCEGGIEPGRLVTATQLLDNACSAEAVAASLGQVLELSLGEDEAQRTLATIVVRLAQRPPSGREGDDGADSALTRAERIAAINDGGLAAQIDYVVQSVGKTRARRFLREATTFDLVPLPDMFGV